MERSTMFLHSLFVLLVVIKATLSCQCKPLTLGQAMCRAKTVVLARVISGENFGEGANSDASLKYKILVQRVFQVESAKLSLNGNYGYMTFPQQTSDCGDILINDVDYVIAGNVNSNGVLVSNTCNHIVQYDYISDDPATTSLILGEVDCNNV